MAAVHLSCSRDYLEDILTVAIGALALFEEGRSIPANAATVEAAIERLVLLSRLIEDCPARATE